MNKWFYGIEIGGVILLVLVNAWIDKTIGKGFWYYFVVFITIVFIVGVSLFFNRKK